MSSIKRYMVALVLVCISVQINSVLACYGLFFLNRKAIASTACEKKTRNCCGKCFLKKKIAATSESPAEETQKPDLPKAHEELPGLVQSIRVVSHLSDAAASGLHYADYLNYPVRYGALPGIDHPPRS